MTIREETEAIERRTLSRYATLSENSLGRRTPLEDDPIRRDPQELPAQGDGQDRRTLGDRDGHRARPHPRHLGRSHGGQRVHDPRLFDISYRRLTLSTCGIVPQIYELAKADLPINLAISLHSAMQDKRASIMPIAKRYGLQELLRAADDYQATTGRRVSFEYTMFRDVNDSEADLAALIHLLKDRGSHVNLIPANHFPGSDFDTPDRERVEAFAAGLNDAGITTTVRRSLGQDIDAACGQLRLRHLAKTDG